MSIMVKDSEAAMQELYDLVEQAGLTLGSSDGAREVNHALEDVAACPLQASELAAVRRLVVALVFRLVCWQANMGWESAAAYCRVSLAYLDNLAPIVAPADGVTITPNAII